MVVMVHLEDLVEGEDMEEEQMDYGVEEDITQKQEDGVVEELVYGKMVEKLQTMVVEEIMMLDKMEFVSYNITLKGLMRMNHTYRMKIAPPPRMASQ